MSLILVICRFRFLSFSFSFYAQVFIENGFAAEGYKTGLLDCFGDIETCAVGCCCPCYLSARNIGKAQPGDGLNLVWCFVGCCGPMLASLWVGRDKVQTKYGIKSEEPIRRYVGAWFCGPCMICQDAREIKQRGDAVPITQA